MEAVSFGGDNP